MPIYDDRTVGRRAFLHQLVLVGSSALTARTSSASGNRPEISQGMRAVGECYLAAYPEEASRDRLLALVPRDPKPLMRQVQRDFERDDLVSVHGWLMSRAECRACALALLS